MADDDIGHACGLEHIGGNLAGECAFLSPVAVLGTDLDVGACGCLHGCIEVDIGGADNDVAVGVRYKGLHLLDERLGLLGGVIHFPVARDNGSAK